METTFTRKPRLPMPTSPSRLPTGICGLPFFCLERKLSSFLEKREARASLAELFALYRAFLTVVVEKMGMVDDSCGVIVTLYQEVFEEYVRLDRTALDMPLEILLQDLIDLMIWEDYVGGGRKKRSA